MIAGIPVIAFVIFLMPVFSFADCAPSSLQSQYDNADHVFHGTLISKQHDPVKHSQTTMVFDVHESFKGIDLQQITAEFNEGYDKKFEQGYEYIVFANDNESSLKVGMCSIQYPAFATMLNIVSQLDDPQNRFGDMYGNQFHQYFTESEKTQLENISETYAKERQKERDELVGQFMLLGIPVTIGAIVVIMWWRKMK